MDKEGLIERAYSILKKLYGKEAKFREGQLEAIISVLTKHRVLVVQKTGWGKSLVYFITTKILRENDKGATFVISPLLALMKNQLEAANKLGLKCEMLNSEIKDKEQRKNIIDRIIDNKVDLVFITPETLLKEEIQSNIDKIRIGMFVVDEAHCISQWGHDFRLEYMQIYKIIELIPKNVPVLATTATANERVIEDLKKQFGEELYISRGKLLRKNLSIKILKLETTAKRYAWMLENIPKIPGVGIIYCLTKLDCRYISDFLNTNGILAEPYYSGSDEELNKNTLEKFCKNDIKVLVSTIKLGMGFDKEDISFIIHFQRPNGIISYYQQIGRAARNISKGYTFMMSGEEDLEIHKYFIETAFPSKIEQESIYNAIYNNNMIGTNIRKLEEILNIKRKRIEKVITFLLSDGLIYKENGKYYITPNKTYYYDENRYSELKSLKYKELEQFNTFLKTQECYGRYIVNCLDDNENDICGVCANCQQYEEFIDEISDNYINKAHEYLESMEFSIEPRKEWPNKEFTGTKKISMKNEIGICLSYYGDCGYGKMVEDGKYGKHLGFSEQLVEKSYNVLKNKISENKIEAITCVPSCNTTLVKDFTIKLANRLKIPFIEIFEKEKSNPQKNMENSYYQCLNAWNSINVKSNIEVPKKVLLVDDIIDSGWTMTVCGYKLMCEGCEYVFP